MPASASEIAQVPPRAPGVRGRVARGLGYTINPLILPPLLFGLALAHLGAPVPEIGWTMGVTFVFFALVPVSYVFWLRARQRIASIEIYDRTRRTRPFLVGIASYGLALVLLANSEGTGMRLVSAIIGCHMVNTALLILVNLRWKISVHAAALAGFLSMLLFVAHTPWPAGTAAVAVLSLDPALLYLLAVGLLPPLVWARVHIGAHTLPQALAGAAFGLAVPYAELSLLYIAGWLLTG